MLASLLTTHLWRSPPASAQTSDSAPAGWSPVCPGCGGSGSGGAGGPPGGWAQEAASPPEPPEGAGLLSPARPGTEWAGSCLSHPLDTGERLTKNFTKTFLYTLVFNISTCLSYQKSCLLQNSLKRCLRNSQQSTSFGFIKMITGNGFRLMDH